MIKGLLFDVGGVVLPFSEWQWHDQKWEALLGLGAGEIQRRVWNSENAAKAVTGELAYEEFMDRLRKELGLTDSQVIEWTDDQNSLVRYDPEIAEWLKDLRPTYQVAFVSNAWSNSRDEFIRLGLDDLCDLMVISGEEGTAKPDLEIFEITTRKLGLTAEECLFVDDRSENVKAAIQLGMKGIIAHDPDRMMADVDALLKRPVR